jgi:ADP-L-glycero-D-manno-heptose 6-epimerase
MEKKNTKPLIVITGAAGMIGSGVVRHLNDLGHTHLLLVDDLGCTEKWKNLLGKRFFHLIPIRELFPYLQGREKEIGAFIHLGACSDTLEKNGDYLMENNYRFSVKLAEFALHHGIRFIYASSAATYGDGSRGFSDDHSLLPQLSPLNLYGFSKHLFDLWADQQGVLSQLVGLKYFNVFGPNEDHKGRMASMVCKMYPLVQKEGVLRLFKSSEPERFSDGGQCRDFIYVKDAARITCDFLQNSAGGIFNVGSGIPSTWNELATHVFHASDLPVRIEYIPMPEDLARQYQNYTCADVQKLMNCFLKDNAKDVCRFSLAEAVSDYVQNYLAKDQKW